MDARIHFWSISSRYCDSLRFANKNLRGATPEVSKLFNNLIAMPLMILLLPGITFAQVQGESQIERRGLTGDKNTFSGASGDFDTYFWNIAPRGESIIAPSLYPDRKLMLRKISAALSGKKNLSESLIVIVHLKSSGRVRKVTIIGNATESDMGTVTALNEVVNGLRFPVAKDEDSSELLFRFETDELFGNDKKSVIVPASCD